MTTIVDIVENPALDKIQNFLNDSLYKELTQNTARYNVRIRKDRTFRQPYIDGQTGVAQRHCNLFVSDKQRMPGILQGQVYTYPARRWRSKHRSYLASFMQATKAEPEEHTITTVENPAAIVAVPPPIVEEAVMIPDKPLKEPWTYYEETVFEEDIDEDFESEEDMEDETYNRKGTKKRKTPGRKPKIGVTSTIRQSMETSPLSRDALKIADRWGATSSLTSRRTRGKKPSGPGDLYGCSNQTKPKKKVVLKAPARLLRSIKKDENDTENKPYVCELCAMRYKTRPGLTYHYAHSHRDEDDSEPPPPPKTAVTPSKQVVSAVPPITPPDQNPPNEPLPYPPPTHLQTPPTNTWPESNGIGRSNRRTPALALGGVREVPPPTPILNAAPSVPPPSEPPLPPVVEKSEVAKKQVSPSPYCDFCLGDSTQNKKTGQSEQLVSCADCGRSGHPSCLQFTQNMMKSVLRYRWQCIECKTCTLCGTSENDDQLLFCDDCDRGYHLYCLTPPLSEPPEGEWSCYLCIKEFHNK